MEDDAKVRIVCHTRQNVGSIDPQAFIAASRRPRQGSNRPIIILSAKLLYCAFLVLVEDDARKDDLGRLEGKTRSAWCGASCNALDAVRQKRAIRCWPGVWPRSKTSSVASRPLVSISSIFPPSCHRGIWSNSTALGLRWRPPSAEDEMSPRAPRTIVRNSCYCAPWNPRNPAPAAFCSPIGRRLCHKSGYACVIPVDRTARNGYGHFRTLDL